jgi:hypothetical protein
MEFLNAQGKPDKPEYEFMDGEMEFTITFAGAHSAGQRGQAQQPRVCWARPQSATHVAGCARRHLHRLLCGAVGVRH